MQSLRQLPKVQLHCHLEGTVRAATFVELSQRYGVSTVYRPDELQPGKPDPQTVYQFATFGEFLLAFAAVSRSLREPGDYVRILREYALDAHRHNVRYAELFISPSVWRFFHPHLDLEQTIRALWKEADRREEEDDIKIRFIVDLTRNFGVESAMQTARLAATLQDAGVVGIGLGGDETKFPAALFGEPFQFARANGLHVVAHAGEAAGAHSVRDAIEVLGAERIGHGVRALEDPAVINLLVERGIPLEICPTSNYLTGAAKREVPHPLVALREAGVKFIIDSDDPTMFGTDVTREFELVEAMVGRDAVLEAAKTAIDVSFASAGERATLRAELLAQRRS